MLTVHHLRISQSERVVWACEELGLPYTLVCYDRDPVTRMGPADYKALHPATTAPVIEDGGLRMAESGAIVEYLARRHGLGRLIVANDDPALADYLFWFHYANASLMSAIMMDLAARRLGIDAAQVAQRGPTRTDIAYDLAEARLGEAEWFAGDAFTLADIMMVFPLTTMRVFAPRDLADTPNIRAYIDRVRARPAYRAAMAKADPDLLPA